MIETIDHGPVRELRLARPPVNALSPELIAALGGAVRAAGEEAVEAQGGGQPGQGVRALVLSGAPGMFSAGLDVPVLLSCDRPAMRTVWHDFYGLLRALAASPLPVAAAITGHSPAGGAVLSIFCDARIMAAGDYQIGLNEVAVGIAMPPVIHAALRRLIGSRQAERLCVSGAMLPAAEALRIGLVDELADGGRTVERAIGWAAEMLALPAAAMAATRRLARADLVALFAAPDEEIERQLDSWFSPETQGTLRALVERLAAKRR
ncbi:MAG TPA: enoyl-CoA hydratase/isomerase family protein [Thermoanaerobaculia bacterium]|nr:enoyl-CoA hydratase/isomerase family protein [Thermoanaerobaculia bacterium]